MKNVGLYMDKIIVSWNINGWLPVRRDITFAEKLKKATQEIAFSDQQPIIIMLQEMISGRDRKYIDMLRKVF